MAEVALGLPRDIVSPEAPAGIGLRYIAGDDPLIAQVEDLCYRMLHQPFGVARQSNWDEMDPFSKHLVALDGQVVVGYARLLNEGKWGHVRQIVVEPAYQRRGIASALVAELVRMAGRVRLRQLYLNSRMPAVSMYQRAGFRVVSKEPFPMPLTYLPHVRMEREVR